MGQNKIRKLRMVEGIDPYMEHWLKEHTVRDLRDLVFEIYNMGEDVNGMVNVVHEIEVMEHEIHGVPVSAAEGYLEFDITDFTQQTEEELAYA